MKIVYKEGSKVGHTLTNDMIEHIVEVYSNMIMRIAFQYTHNLHEAEDIMQDTFMAMMDKRSFKSDAHLRHWLIRVAINKSVNFLKSPARRVLRLDDPDNPLFAFTPQERETIEELDKLTEKDRTIIYLHYYEGYSMKEISKILRMTQNSVYVRMTRARRKLKSLIEEGYEK